MRYINPILYITATAFFYWLALRPPFDRLALAIAFALAAFGVYWLLRPGSMAKRDRVVLICAFGISATMIYGLFGLAA